MIDVTSWLTRTALAESAAEQPRGRLVVPPAGECVVGLDSAERKAALEIAGSALQQAGLTADDRVVVALTTAGDGATLLVDALVAGTDAVASVGPRGRMRLLRAIEAVRPSALVITPTGALDLLARLHAEFLVDPEDLGLRRLVLVGEIVEQRRVDQLAREFDAEPVRLYVDPVFGVPLASGATTLATVDANVLRAAHLARDETVDGQGSARLAELVLRPSWSSGLGETTIRTGEVVEMSDDGAWSPVRHTVGEHVMVRGRWIPLPELDRRLAKIDGIAVWSLGVQRAGTLDAAELSAGLARESLVGNPMWQGRIKGVVDAITPVDVTVTTELADSEAAPPRVVDSRGHHLGTDRAQVAA